MKGEEERRLLQLQAEQVERDAQEAAAATAAAAAAQDALSRVTIDNTRYGRLRKYRREGKCDAHIIFPYIYLSIYLCQAWLESHVYTSFYSVLSPRSIYPSDQCVPEKCLININAHM